ncbi:hypothetical protein B7494_g2484 [Chlorociboria aeruginascens]|nr:hypothetical protein B7494_g2484 [Chlorociboria aeruginascens]
MYSKRAHLRPPLHIYTFSLLVHFCSALSLSGWWEKTQDAASGGLPRLLGNSFGVPGMNQTYDYVIVGGGTAGLTIAARLAEDPRGFSVAVVEAGSFSEIENGNLTDVPGYNGWSSHPMAVRPSMVEWDFVTAPQPWLNGQAMHYSQGRTLGGSSAINNLGYQRPTVGAHKMWADVVGDDAWTWENVLPFYKKSCAFTSPDFQKLGEGIAIPYEASDYEASGGPLSISYGNFRGAYTNAVAAGLAKIGLQEIPGLTSGILSGYGPIPFTLDPTTVRRSTSETAFLQSAMKTTSLQTYINTLAKRILFNDDKKATGVVVAAQGQTQYEFVLSATKEVIVTSGVFRSPQLLMVSGIGPETTLEQFNIPVISPLAGVGQNLWDQPYYHLHYQVNVTTMTQMENPEYAAAAAEAYFRSGTGPLSTGNAGEVIGFDKFPQPYRSRFSNATLEHLATFPDDFPEIEYLPFGSAPHPDSVPSSPSNNWMTFAVGVETPASRGNVTILSADTNDQPLVNPNLLLDPIDVELAVQGILRMREWAEATGIVVAEVDPGPAVVTDEQIQVWMKEAGSLLGHGTSTCAMGKADDPNAVVDTDGRVYGVTGLRVADASAMPFLVPGHPIGAVFMMAEKIAHAILNQESSDQIDSRTPRHLEL